MLTMVRLEFSGFKHTGDKQALTLYSCLTASGSAVFRADSREGNSSIRAQAPDEEELQIHTPA